MKIIIVGSGYTAVWTYRALTRWLRKKADITIVSKTDKHSFHGFIGEVLAGNIAAHLTYSPVDECFPKAKFILGEATQINPAAHTLTVKSDTGTQELTYDQIVIATGSDEHTTMVPGLTEHGWRLRSPGVPHQLVEHLTTVAEHATPGMYTAENTVAIIGAGFTGTESAAALKRRFGNKIKVALITTSNTAIPEWSQHKISQKHLERNLQASGVEILRRTRVTQVDAENVHLNNGTSLPAKTVIASTGMRPTHIKGVEPYIHEGTHLLTVDNNLYVGDDIWAAGDVAAVKNPRGQYVTKDALWAIYAGTRMGRNIARVARGKEPKPFTFKGLGSVATFAPGRSVARMFGLPFNGFPIYTLRQILFLWFVPSRFTALRAIKSMWLNRKAGRAHLTSVELA